MAKKKPIQLKLRIPAMTRFPGGLHKRLVKSAKIHECSLNSEIISRLEESYRMHDVRTAIRETIGEIFGSGLL